MKDFFRNKKKFLLVVMLMVVTLTGCSVPRGQNGKTYVNSIYTIKDVQVKRGEVDIQLLIFLFSIKSQVASQRMQAIQPEMNKIQAKYAGKTDDRSKMQQAQEMQALYSKYKINPFGTLLVTFIQFPVILGMYQATMRAYSVVTGSFQGINLAKTPIEGFNLGNYWYVVIFVLMVAFQLLSFKMPQWLQEHRKKKLNIKEKKYAEPKKKGGNGMMGSMNMMMYMSTGMIAIFAINWPLGMSFYWLVNSLARVIQNIVIHKFFIKD